MVQDGYKQGMVGGSIQMKGRQSIFQQVRLRKTVNYFHKIQSIGWNSPFSPGNCRKILNTRSGCCAETQPREEINC